MKSASDKAASGEGALTWEQLRGLCAPYFELPTLTPLTVVRRNAIEEVHFNELKGRGRHAIQIEVRIERSPDEWQTEAYVIVQAHELLCAAACLVSRMVASTEDMQYSDDFSPLFTLI